MEPLPEAVRVPPGPPRPPAPPTTGDGRPAPGPFGGWTYRRTLRELLAEIWLEWRQVVWPAPAAVAHNTMVVAGAIVVLVALVALYDLGARAVTSLLFG